MDFGTELRNFSLPANQSMVNAASLKEHLTLRNACIDYRDAKGISWVPNKLPEASAAQSADQIPCLNMFRNIIGHMDRMEIICFPITRANSFVDMIDILADRLHDSIAAGRYWAIPRTVKYHATGESHANWVYGAHIANEDESRILTLLSQGCPAPLSANTTHSAMEANHFMEHVGYRGLFLYPHNAAVSVGIIGSLHDNECIDMSPGEEKKVPNMERRSWRPEYLGYICAGHTSHSTEAGRVRRVTCSTRVRLLTEATVEDLTLVSLRVANTSSRHITSDMWTVFCMGIYCEMNDDEVRELFLQHRLRSLTGTTLFSLHISTNLRFINISISSGTLVKQTSSGYHADNIETHLSSNVASGIRPIIDTSGKDQHRACFSAFFNLVPYISSDRAPRPLISSVQTPQAVCLVWCPGNAAVSPCYSFDPIVTTPLYERIRQDLHGNEASISCYLPGENVTCMYLNLEYNYEDAIMISKRYLDNGGFSTVSMCSYNLPQNEYIPPVGSTMCGVLSRWWKSPCQKGCTHKTEDLAEGSTFTVGYKPTGVVHSTVHLGSGDVNVRIRSYQQLQPGDKLSMGHGQKGIAVPVSHEDMPIAYSPKHGYIVPDIVMAMSSIVTRQTNGVLYEAAKSLSILHDRASVPAVINACEIADVSDEFIAISGVTGEPYKTIVYDNNGNVTSEPTCVTVGFNRVMNQTQMSRERHQVSHVHVGKNTLRTPDGRARGGGVAWGEMEVQSTSSAGLQSCDNEIRERGDVIVGRWCQQCQRLGLLCTCTTEEHHILAKASYDLVVVDCINAITQNGSFQYKLTPEFQ